MNRIFVLSTGRCGSVTFSRAAGFADNYTVGHEALCGEIGEARFSYPDNHIEVDNRLSWVLGRLDRAYGDNARYVHLTRDPEEVAKSFLKRWGMGIIGAYSEGILVRPRAEDIMICRDYVDTVNANIEHFLENKSRVIRFQLEKAETEWPHFWQWAGCTGDYERAQAQWSIVHNASGAREAGKRPNRLIRALRRRILGQRTQ